MKLLKFHKLKQLQTPTYRRYHPRQSAEPP